MKKIVYVVHCVDTEGPMDETLEATFDRIYEFTGKRIEPTVRNLKMIQKGEMDLNGYEDAAKIAFSEHILSYNRNFGDIDEMLKELTSNEFRQKHTDDFGEGWKYSWFILDNVGYKENPRSRILGYNSIYDHYKLFYKANGIKPVDDFQLHLHPMNYYGIGNRNATSYFNTPSIVQTLCRRLIDRGEFANCFRPGFHCERPDSNWLLEQFIPFDFGNQAIEIPKEDKKQPNIGNGRLGDWRRAPSDWSEYHPSIDDYQKAGECNRVIFRCLNIGTRHTVLNQEEVDKAFCRANEGIPTVMAFTNHDFRDMRSDVSDVYAMIKNAKKKYPEVCFKNEIASSAAKEVLNLDLTPIEIRTHMEGNKLSVSTNIDSFGPQPFLALKIKGGIYYSDNFDFQEYKRKWSYVFDEDTVKLEDVEKIGIATNSLSGTGCLVILDTMGNTILKKQW